MRIVTLLVRHGTAKYTQAAEQCDSLFALQLPNVERDVVLIDNTLPKGYEQVLGSGQVLIGASNADWEFSGWDCGISYLGRRICDYDFVNLATSAFRELYVRYLDRFDATMLSSVSNRAAAVGHIDFYNEPVILYGRSLQAWIRSSFMFLPPEELLLLGSLVSIKDRASIFSNNPDAPFRADAPLSSNYQKYIFDWLTGSGTGQGVEWHSRFRLTPQTLILFEVKASAILNEQMLSVRLRAQGCALVDATWLATGNARYVVERQLSEIPSWRRQVTARDTDAAPQSLVAKHQV